MKRSFKPHEFIVLTAVLISVVLPAVAYAGTRAEQDRSVLASVLGVTCKYLGRTGKRRFEVLDAESTDLQQVIGSKPKLPEAYLDAFRDLLRRNLSRKRLPAGIACSHIRVVSHERIKELFSHQASAWRAFYSAFPGAEGIDRISLPGYSGDGRRAVVYRAGSCGDLCGAGFLVLLRKHGSAWIVERSVGVWIS